MNSQKPFKLVIICVYELKASLLIIFSSWDMKFCFTYIIFGNIIETLWHCFRKKFLWYKKYCCVEITDINYFKWFHTTCTWFPPSFLYLRIFLRAKFILFCQSHFILNLWSSVWSLILWLLLSGMLLIKERHRLMNRRSTKWSNYSTNGQNQKTQE